MKRGQAWGFDVIIGFVIFTAVIVIFYLYVLNAPGQSQEEVESLQYEGGLVTNSLLSEGFPKNWTTTDVQIIGILESDKKINETKLANFETLTTTQYQQTKTLFNIKNEYYVEFSEPSISAIGLAPINQENLVRIERLTIYQNKPITMTVQIWN